MSSVLDTSRQPKRKQRREDRLVTFYARAWGFFDRNQTLVYGVLAGLVVVALAVVGYLYYQNQQEEAARQALAQVTAAYQNGNYEAALQGDTTGTGSATGLLGVVDEYGGTPSGNLARFYAADAYYNLGQYDQALSMLQDYDEGDDLFGAGALAMEAAIHENQGALGEAGERYLDAAERYPSEFVAPQYLLSAGRAFEEAGRYDDALSAYQRIGEAYPDADAAQEAQRYIARARARQGG